MPRKPVIHRRRRRKGARATAKRAPGHPSLESGDDAVETEVLARGEGNSADDVAAPEAGDAVAERDDPATADGHLAAAAGHDHTASNGFEAAADRGPESGQLVPFDPLTRYLAELRRFPLLSREQESEIARRYAKYHDRADAYKLVTANLRLVVKIANEFARASRNLLDLIQEGNVGLMEAVKNFDPYRGIRFPSYAVWWVRAYIYRYLINNWRLVKIGTTQAQRKLFFNLRKESERLEAEGFTPQPRLLAQRMGVKESQVREMQERMAQSEVSLDAPASAEDDTRLGDLIADTEWTPEEATTQSEWRRFARDRVEQFAATLKDKELEIFRSRLLTEDPPTLQEVGARFGISRERVRQIESRLKRRLKEFVEQQATASERAER